MFCWNCGKKVLETMRYCPYCGIEIIMPDQNDEPEERALTDKEDELSFATSDQTKSHASDSESGRDNDSPKVDDFHIQSNWSEDEEDDESIWSKKIDTADEDVDDDLRLPPRRTSKANKPEPKPDNSPRLKKEPETLDELFASDDELDEDDYDVYADSQKSEPADVEYESDDSEDDEYYEDGFFSRHLMGFILGLLLLLIVGGAVFFIMTDAGQTQLAKLPVNLPVVRAETYGRLGYDAYQAGDYAEAGAQYEHALQKDNKNYSYASSAAAAYIAGQDKDKAAEMLKKCIQLKPDAVEPYIHLLRLYPYALSRPEDITQLIDQGYLATGDARLKSE